MSLLPPSQDHSSQLLRISEFFLGSKLSTFRIFQSSVSHLFIDAAATSADASATTSSATDSATSVMVFAASSSLTTRSLIGLVLIDLLVSSR